MGVVLLDIERCLFISCLLLGSGKLILAYSGFILIAFYSQVSLPPVDLP